MDQGKYHATRNVDQWPQLGMLMFIISNLVGSTIQITTLPLPVLSTLQAVGRRSPSSVGQTNVQKSGLVFNSICATLILGEPFTRYSLAGTLLVAGGAGLIASFGAINEPAHSLNQLLELLGRWQFVLWVVSTAIIVIAILVGSRVLKALSGSNSNGPRMRLFRGMAYGGVSGILSAHSLLVAKSAVELLVRTIVAGDNQFNRFPSWLILLGLVALALSQLYFLHRGLKLCSTSVLYPFVFCVYNIIAILDGLIYFRQVSRLSLLAALMVSFVVYYASEIKLTAYQIALGTIILLTGVICLSWRLNSDPSTKPPIGQTPLTPGMGFVPTDSDSDDEEETLLSPTYEREEDEESSTLLQPPTRSFTLPTNLGTSSLSPALSSQPTYGTTSAAPPRPRRTIRLPSPSQSSSRTSPSSLKLSRARRSRTTPAFLEADEIWGELEEDIPTPILSPISTRRRSSLGASRTLTPSRLRPASVGGALPSALGSTADLPPATSPLQSPQPTEQTGLLARSGTGRNYRDRRRRRSTTARSEVLAGGSSVAAERGRRKSQDALGGWWKMRWLKIAPGRDKDGKRKASGVSSTTAAFEREGEAGEAV